MMSDYNWCHNPDCHTYHTTDRIRGVKGSKVLRTRKIKVRDYSQSYYWQGWENHFCRVACFFNFVKKHVAEIVAIAPVLEPSETPIDVKVENRDTYRYRHTDNGYERVPHVEKVKTIVPINK
jgi:hypothetical protein|tara:strand:+ start:596 stop:961 length:366 start_codon:yes stop_codon:yes gene_type:complete